jgi:methionine-rich copper-binding protein CopC
MFQNRRKEWKALSVILLVLLLALFASAAYAQEGGGGGGGGGGTGGGKDEPLDLESSNPVDGATNVSRAVQIKLTFNKNVVHSSVRDANAQKFSLLDANGSQVAIDVIMADDEQEPEKRNDVILKPKKTLEPDAVYKVVIAAGLQSKSLAVLAGDIEFTFTTAAVAAMPRTSSYPDLTLAVLMGGALITGLGIQLVRKKR